MPTSVHRSLPFVDLTVGDRIKLGEAFGSVTQKSENRVVIVSDGGREFSLYAAEFDAMTGIEVIPAPVSASKSKK